MAERVKRAADRVAVGRDDHDEDAPMPEHHRLHDRAARRMPDPVADVGHSVRHRRRARAVSVDPGRCHAVDRGRHRAAVHGVRRSATAAVLRPRRLACGIVTCGGLCPGVNDVIRSIVHQPVSPLRRGQIYGFRFGYEGLVSRHGHTPLELTPASVNRIHARVGRLLGSSRGPQDAGEMVERLEVARHRHSVRDRRRRNASRCEGDRQEAARQGVPLAVMGVPKTIDNDVSFVQKTFGFETAVTEARRATSAANTEAEAARNGIGLVKVMGRDSGFIAAYSVLVERTGQLLPRPGSAVHARQVPGRAGAPARTAPACRHRRR